MSRAKTIEDKITLVNILNRTNSQEVLESFSNQKGCRMLAQYLKFYKKYVIIYRFMIYRYIRFIYHLILLQCIQDDRESQKLYDLIMNYLWKVRTNEYAQKQFTELFDELKDVHRRFPEQVRRQFNNIYSFWKHRKLRRSRSNSKSKKKFSRSRSRSRSQTKRRNKEVKYVGKKQVRFQQEHKIKQTKYFYLNDEPNAKGVSEEEYQKIRQKYLEEIKGNIIQCQSCLQQNIKNINCQSCHLITQNLMKNYDRMMENKGKTKLIQQEQQKLRDMNNLQEQINYSRPPKVLLCTEDQHELGDQSHEKVVHSQRIATKLSCFYISEIMVPDAPNMDHLNATQQMDMEEIVKEMPKEEQEEDNQECNKEFEYLLQIMEKQNDYQIINVDILNKPVGKSIMKTKDKAESGSKELDPELLQKLIQLLKDKDGLNQEQKNRQLQQIMIEMKKKSSNTQVIQNIQKVKQVLQILNQKQNLDQQLDNQRMQHMKGKFRGDYQQPEQKMSIQPQSPSKQQQPIKPGFQNNKYKTVPCRMYHSERGCNRGELCHFIHDPKYEGKEIPRFADNNVNKFKKFPFMNPMPPMGGFNNHINMNQINFQQNVHQNKFTNIQNINYLSFPNLNMVPLPSPNNFLPQQNQKLFQQPPNNEK